MFKRMRKLVALMCVLALAASVVACGQAGNGKQAGTEGTKSAVAEKGAEGTAAAKDYGTPVKMTYAKLGCEKYPDDPLVKYMFNKFGLDPEWIPIVWDSWDEKVKIWVASGDMPDAVHWQFALPGAATDYVNWSKDGLIKELPDLSDYPNLKAVSERKGDIFKKLYSVSDNKLFAWPFVVDVNQWNKVCANGYLFRRDWANKLGYDFKDFLAPMTIQQFMQMNADFVKKDPNGNGAGKTLGFAGNYVEVPVYTYLYAYNANYNMFYKDPGGTYKWGPNDSSTLDGIKFVKQAYDTGAINKDFYEQKAQDTDVYSKFYIGQTGCIQERASPSVLWNRINEWKKQNPNLKPEDSLGLAVLKNDKGESYGLQEPEYWSTLIFSPDIDKEVLGRYFDMMEWAVSEEGIMTYSFGIPGTDWEMQDGKFVCEWPKDANGVQTPPSNYASLGSYFIAKTEGDSDYIEGNPKIPSFLQKAIPDMLKMQGEKYNSNATYDFTRDFCSGETFTTEGAALNQDVINKIVKMVVTPGTNIDEEWKAYLDSKAAVVQKCLAELNSAK